MAAIFLVMLGLYLIPSYQTMLTAAKDDAAAMNASSAPRSVIFEIDQGIVVAFVNTSGIALSQSNGDVAYYVVSSSQNSSEVLGLVYLTTDVAWRSTFGYNSWINTLVYVDQIGIIRAVTILNDTESYADRVSQEWLNTLVNRSVYEPLVVGGDVRGITQATYTSDGIVNGVRDAGRIVVNDYNTPPPPPPPPPPLDFLFLTANGGVTDPPAGVYSYNQSFSVTVTARSNDTVTFVRWDLDGKPAGTNPSITVYMNSSHSLTAYFSAPQGVTPPPVTHNLVIQDSSGQTIPQAGIYQYGDGTLVVVFANDTASSKLEHWELDGGNITASASITITMDRDHVLRTLYAAVQPPSPPPPGIFSLIQPKDLLVSGTYIGFFVAAVLIFKENRDRYTNLLFAGSVLFIGFFEGRMVTIVDSVLLKPQNFPPILTHLLWYALYAGVLVTTILLGRVYCGYICPFGALISLVNKALPFSRKLPARVHNNLVYLKYVVLAFVVFEVLAGEFAVLGVEPFQVIFLFKGDWWMVLLAAGFLSMSAVFSRFYCKYVCPAGAAMALVGQLRVYEIKRWDECSKCRICDRTCPEGAIVKGRIKARECLNCRICESNYLNEDLCPHYSLGRIQR